MLSKEEYLTHLDYGVKPVCSKLIIDEYIRKLEIELGVLLNNGKNDY